MSGRCRIGYWYSEKEPHYPKPIATPNPWKGKYNFLAELEVIESEAGKLAYKGYSRCRICNAVNGSIMLMYKHWEWPSGYMHYVKVHNIKPTKAFIDFIHAEYEKL